MHGVVSNRLNTLDLARCYQVVSSYFLLRNAGGVGPSSLSEFDATLQQIVEKHCCETSC